MRLNPERGRRFRRSAAEDPALPFGRDGARDRSHLPQLEERLFAGSDGGAEHWATIAALVETCKLNSVGPHLYLADVTARIVAGHPQSQPDDLLPRDLRAAVPQSLGPKASVTS